MTTFGSNPLKRMLDRQDPQRTSGPVTRMLDREERWRREEEPLDRPPGPMSRVLGPDPIGPDYSREIELGRAKLEHMGIEPPPPVESDPPTLTKILDALNWVNFQKNKAIMSALGVEDTPDRVWGEDVLHELGLEEGLGTTVGGLAFDILTDPITYLTFGAGSKVGAGTKVLGATGRAGARIGTGVPFTRAGVAAEIPGSAEVLGRAGEVARSAVTGLGKGIERATPELAQAGRAMGTTAKRLMAPHKMVPKEVSDVMRKFGDLSKTDTVNVVEDIAQLTRKWPAYYDDLRIIDAIEKGNIYKLSPSEQTIASDVQKLFNDMADMGLSHNVLDDVRANYVAHVFRGDPQEVRKVMIRKKGEVRVETTTPHSLPRQLEKDLMEIIQDPELRRVANPVTKIPELLGMYKMSLHKAIRNKEMLDELVALGPDVVRKSTDAPHHFVPSPIPQLSHYSFEPEVARYLQETMNPFFQMKSMEELGGFIDRITNLWKTWATVPNPGFHIRNEMGNLFNNWLAGVRTPDPYIDAFKAIRHSKETIDLPHLGKVTYDEVRDMAKRMGVTERGFFGADVGELITQRIAQEAPRGMAKVSPFRLGHKMGKAFEDHSRLAHFIDKIKIGNTPEQAAQSVKRSLFDYSELTGFERNVMRRVYPFWSWSRYNIPYQLSELVKQPGIASKMGKFKDFMESMAHQTVGGEMEEELLPEHLQRMYSFRLPFQLEGRDIVLGFDLPIRDVNSLGPKEIFSSLNPFLTVPIEQITNRNVFFERELEQFEGQTYRAAGYLQGLWKMSEALEEGDDTKTQFRQIADHFGMSVAPNYDTGEPELRIPTRFAHILNQLVFLKNIGKVVDFQSGEIWDPMAITSPVVGISGMSATPRDLSQLRQREEHRTLTDLQRQLRHLGVEIPTVEEMEEDIPRRRGGISGRLDRYQRQTVRGR